MAAYFAWTETRARYRRSVLGPLWITLGTLIGSLGLAFVWATILNSNVDEFIPYITIGIVLWQVVSGAITEAAGNFYRNITTFQERPISPYFFSYQLTFKGLVSLAHSLPFIILILAALGTGLRGTELWAIPGILILFGHILWISHLIAFLGARYRDLDPMLSNLMPIIFFLTPILYDAGRLGDFRFLADFNPFIYLIDVVRGPLIGVTPDFRVYVTLIVALLIGIWLSALVNQKIGRKLLHWM